MSQDDWSTIDLQNDAVDYRRIGKNMLTKCFSKINKYELEILAKTSVNVTDQSFETICPPKHYLNLNISEDTNDKELFDQLKQQTKMIIIQQMIKKCPVNNTVCSYLQTTNNCGKGIQD